MTTLLMLAVVILGAMLMDMRKRLAFLEERMRRDADAPRPFAAAEHPEPTPTSAPIPAPALISVPLSRSVVSTGVLDSPPVEQMSPIQAGDEGLGGEEASAVEEPVWPSPEPVAIAAAATEGGGGRPSFSFEDIFGRKLPIWAGGITLAVATVLFVKYSIEVGLLSPLVRVVLGMIFGSGLIAGAEWARSREDLIPDVRIPQALAGAGIASFYASILAAANLYHFIGGGTAFAGLALTTGLAMGLSLRFGAPSAVLGLVGGLAAPALVGATAPNIALLCGYLALAIGGLTAVSRRQRWMWLGIGALIGGVGWTAVMMLTGVLGHGDTLAVGLLILMLAAIFPAFAFGGSDAAAPRLLASLAGAAQMAVLVATGGFGSLQWGLYGLLSGAMLWLARRNAGLTLVPVIGLAVALMLAAAWPVPSWNDFVPVMLVMAALYGAPALWDLHRGKGDGMQVQQLIAIGIGGYLIALFHFHHGPAEDGFFAGLALACAALPFVATALCWRARTAAGEAGLGMLAAATAILVVLSGFFGLPDRWWGIAAALAIVAVAEISRAARRDAVLPAAGVFATAAALCAVAPMQAWFGGALLSVIGAPLYVGVLPAPIEAATKLATPAAMAAFACWRLWPRMQPRAHGSAVMALIALAVASGHIFYKQLFALDGYQDFLRLGLAERTLWEALLLASGYALWRLGAGRRVAMVAVGAGAAHALWYSLLLHNPMTMGQAVGSLPLANLLIGACGIPFAALWLAGRIAPEWMARWSRQADVLRMVLTLFFAFASLRQFFAGSILTAGTIGDAENILRSMLAIALAISFLLWGIGRHKHDWRIASLLLMLGAVAKVFLFDISGLAGLSRILSFLALGFSLIGIGWLYSRFLRKEDKV